MVQKYKIQKNEKIANKLNKKIDASETSIYEYNQDGVVKVKQQELLNMGDPNVLVNFINYGKCLSGASTSDQEGVIQTLDGFNLFFIHVC